MAKIITVSQVFPSYHPRKGQKTYFKEMIWGSLYNQGIDLSNYIMNPELYMHNNWFDKSPKNHTIRAGKRWKNGDKASIRVWGDDVNPKSGRKGAYHSKQITIAPDVEVAVFDFEIKNDEADEPSIYIDGKFYCQIGADDSKLIAKNDGLNLEDLKAWFRFPQNFSGQLITWKKDLKY